jgi:hypothetical protein
MVADTPPQDGQGQPPSGQDTQTLGAEDSFHVDLEANVVDPEEQRAIDDVQAEIQRSGRGRDEFLWKVPCLEDVFCIWWRNS